MSATINVLKLGFYKKRVKTKKKKINIQIF